MALPSSHLCNFFLSEGMNLQSLVIVDDNARSHCSPKDIGTATTLTTATTTTTTTTWTRTPAAVVSPPPSPPASPPSSPPSSPQSFCIVHSPRRPTLSRWDNSCKLDCSSKSPIQCPTRYSDCSNETPRGELQTGSVWCGGA